MQTPVPRPALHPSSPPAPGWRLQGPPAQFTGFAYGSRYPTLIFTMAGPALTAGQRSSVLTGLQALLPGIAGAPGAAPGPDSSKDGWLATAEWLLAIIDQIQATAGMPVFDTARTLRVVPPAVQCSIPAMSRSLDLSLRILRCVLEIVPALAEGRQAPSVAARLVDLFGRLCAMNYAPRLVRAACELGIPFQELPGAIMQYGLGKRACWMDMTFTQDTPVISAQLARSKDVAAAMLRRAGVPAPEHYRAATPQEAVKLAERMGYPVVVKPADRDAGLGVAADLRNAGEVVAAFEQACRHSEQILVEQHVHGNDYRLTVMHGEIIRAVERVPASVTGDGASTIAQLVDRINEDPRRGDTKHSPLKPLVLDGEARELLHRENLSPSSIPASMQFVRLRRTANVASGGFPIDVTKQVHPDNARLAIRAAAALRLDLAGVDLLIPDIARSWHETGAGICEVNAQPQLGGTTSPEIYTNVLKKLVKGDGRLTVVLVIAPPSDSTLVSDLAAALQEQGLSVGYHNGSGVSVNGVTLVQGEVSTLAAGQMLGLDSDVEVMLLSASDASLLRTGLPVARLDLLVLAGSHLHASQQSPAFDAARAMQAMLRLILPACDDRVFTLGTPDPVIEDMASLTGARIDDEPYSPESLINALAAAVVAANLRHAAPL